MNDRAPPGVPLRVGVLIDSFEVPRWVRRAITRVRALPVATVVVVVQSRAAGPRRRPGGFRHRLFDLFSRFEERAFRCSDDVLARDTVAEALVGVPILEVRRLSGVHGDRLATEDVERLRTLDLDVVLCFGRPLEGAVLDVARYGVWAHEPSGEAAAFWEVVEGHPVTASGLRRLGPPDAGDGMIYRSLSPTDRHSVRRTRRHMFGKGAEFAARKLADLHERGPVALSPEPVDVPWSSPRARGVPGNLGMAGPLARLGGRLILSKWRARPSIRQWRIGVLEGDGSIDLGEVGWLAPPPDREWADPFPIWSDGRYLLFIEEHIYREGRAHIAVMERQADGTWSWPVPVLRRDCHLSYPFVFAWEGAWYMIPETATNRAVELYRCRAFPHEWEPYEVLLHDVNAADATLFEAEGRWWMLCAIGAGEHNWDELHVFHADRPLGPWRPHRRNPVKSDVRSARPAGGVFVVGGELRRPAQDCSECYGYAVSIQRIERLTLAEYREREVDRIEPRSPLLAVHTLNRTVGLTAVDARMRVPRACAHQPEGWVPSPPRCVPRRRS